MHAWGGRRDGPNQLPNTACGMKLVHPAKEWRYPVPSDELAWNEHKTKNRDCHVCLRCDRIVTAARLPRGE